MLISKMIVLIEISIGYQILVKTEKIAGIQKMQNAYLCSIYFIYEKHVFCFIFEYALLEFDVKWKLFPFNHLIFEIIVKVKGVMHSSFFIISAIIIHKWTSKLKRFWWGRFFCKDDWLLLLAGQERSRCLLHTKKQK